MQNNGLEGLGALNTNKNVSCMETPNGFLQKRDTDDRKLATDFTKFISVDKFNEYLKTWFLSTGLFNMLEVEESLKAQLNFSSIFYAILISNSNNTSDNNCFCIISCLNLDNVQTIISLLESSNNSIINNKAVLIFYGNISNNIRDRAKRLGLELIGSEEIYDINQAIDSADKGIPYISTNGSKFSSILANRLNHLYKNKQSLKNSVSNEANSLGSSLGSAFTDGFEQLKTGVTNLFNSFKSNTQVNNTYNNVEQTSVQSNPQMEGETEDGK